MRDLRWIRRDILQKIKPPNFEVERFLFFVKNEIIDQ